MQQNNIERVCRLTPLQDGMYFEALRKQGSGEVIYQVCLDLAGHVRPALLREAWNVTVRRHPILRTSFHDERVEEPVQVARRQVEVPWVELDWRGVDPAERSERWARMLAADLEQPFTLTRAPLMRVTHVRHTDDSSQLVWSYHHLLLDGWSMYLALDDVFRYYRELAAGRPVHPEPVRPYWEYVSWLQGRGTDAAEEFWRGRLAGFTAPTPLGFEETHRADGAVGSDEIHSVLSPTVAASLDELARRHRITLATVLQAAWAVTLSRYSGAEDVVFGAVGSGRSPEFDGIDDMVGLFINVLPVRVHVEADRPLLDWLREVQGQLADAREHEHASLSAVQRWSEVPRGVPLFESLAVFINYPVRESWTDGGELQVIDVQVLQQSHYPLHLTAVADDTGWRLTLGYDPSRFSRATIARLFDLLTLVLATISAGEGYTVGELPQWNATAPLAVLAGQSDEEPAPALTLVDLIDAVVAQRPEAVAVTDGVEQLSYRDLITRARHLSVLLTEAGAGRELPVEIALPRPVDRVVTLLAATLAGAAVVATSPGTGRVVDTVRVTALEDRWDLSRATGTEPGPRPGGWEPVLTIGADGDPASVLLTQGGAVRLLFWLQRTMPLSPDDRVLCAGPSEDFATFRDMLWTLAVGATLVTTPHEADAADPAVLAAHAVTVAILSTADAVSLAEGLFATPTPKLRRVVCGPTVLPGHAVRRLRARPGLEVVEEPSVAAPAVLRRRHHARAFPVLRRDGLVENDPRTWAVEAVLHRHPGITDAVVLVDLAEDGSPRLSAYVVQVDDGPTPAELVAFVAARLGQQATPDTFVTLDAVPRTPTGQVDVQALPARPNGGGAAERRTDVVTEVLTGIWTKVLGVSPGDLQDDQVSFFDLGGHSLMAIKLVARIRAAFGVNFTLNDLFTAPTIDGNARVVRAALAEGREWESETPIPRAPRDVTLPVSFAQERLWFLDQISTGQPNNVILAARVAQHLDAELLRAALAAVVERHEVLRTLIRDDDGQLVQVILPESEPALFVDDLSHLPRDIAERQARALLEGDVRRAFDVGLEAPLRTRLIRISADDHVLGVCVHHVAFDGWSTGVFFDELSAAYRDVTEGRPASRSAPAAQYADYAVWQRERLTGDRLDRLLGYWLDHLGGAPQVLDLGAALPQLGQRAGGGAAQAVLIPAEVADELRQLVSDENSTLFMALFAAYAVLLARQAGQDVIVVGVPSAGRIHPDVEGLVGFFVNTLPMRVDLADRPTYRELVRRIRQTSLGAFAHQDLPFEKIVSAVSPDRAGDRLPLVQVGFNMQNSPMTSLEFNGREAEFFPVNQEVVRFDLDLEIYAWHGGLRCVLHYAVDRYQPAFVAGLAAEYLDLVRLMVTAPDSQVPGGTGDTQVPVSDELEVLSRGLLRAGASSGTRAER